VKYYVQLDSEGKHELVWKFDGAVLEAVYDKFTPITIAPGTSVEDTLRQQVPASSNHKVWLTELAPGEYFPRMARPLRRSAGHARNFYYPKQNPNEVAIFRGQLAVLAQKLEEICRVIYPTKETLKSTFGHEIRNLLILACTEVETHWRGVLEYNGVNLGPRPTTKEYVRLSGPMRLREYAVAYPNYPWLEPFRPFKQWGSSGAPTQEIEWYDAYNSVKHDRERNFDRATLRSAFEAVTACAIMQVAEFSQVGLTWELWQFFELRDTPTWSPSEFYLPLPPIEPARAWVPKKYPFS
jgi:hypothetical protein